MTFTLSFPQLFALIIVLIAASWLAGLRNGERTRRPRIELKKRRYGYRPFWERT